jgi:hypothetical protein
MTRTRAVEQALPGFADVITDPARVAGGRAGLFAGVAWEHYLELQHRRATGADIAHAWQSGRPVIGYDPHNGAPRYGTAPPDFVGCILGAGNGHWRSLAIEAKTRGSRLQQSELEVHQREGLATIAGAGGVALVAIELRDHGGRWVIPWRELDARWNRAHGGASVGPADLLGFELVDHPAGYLAAFVPGGRHA